jgi:hypothetical protein
MSCEVTLLMVRKSGLEGFVAGFVSTLEMTGRIYACDVLRNRTCVVFWMFLFLYESVCPSLVSLLFVWLLVCVCFALLSLLFLAVFSYRRRNFL